MCSSNRWIKRNCGYVGSRLLTATFTDKLSVGFGLAFGTNNWIALEGYSKAFGEIALIAGFFIALAVPVRRSRPLSDPDR